MTAKTASGQNPVDQPEEAIDSYGGKGFEKRRKRVLRRQWKSVTYMLWFSYVFVHCCRQLWGAGPRAPRLPSSGNNLFSSLRTCTKFITVNSIWFLFHTALKTSEIISIIGNEKRALKSFSAPNRTGSAYGVTFNPLGGQVGRMPLPFFNQWAFTGLSSLEDATLEGAVCCRR